MSTIELLPELGPPNADQAEAWVQAALAEVAVLRHYDERFFPKSSDPLEIESSERVHELWRRWLEQAELLQNALRPLLEGGQPIRGARELDAQTIWARGWLGFTPEGQARAVEQAQRGELIDGDDVRRDVAARRAAVQRGRGEQ